MNCDDYAAHTLSGDTSAETDRHLAECASCRSDRDGLGATRVALADPAVWEEPPAMLEGQVVALITTGTAPTLDRGSRDRRRWRTRWVAIIAGVIVVVAVATVVTVARSSPDWDLTLTGTDLARSASSEVHGWNMPSGTRMVLDIEGLEPAPDGFVYELWLSRERLHVSAGTFVAGGRVELTTGVARSDFPRLWVTLEPLDDDESPSGRTVLDTSGWHS